MLGRFSRGFVAVTKEALAPYVPYVKALGLLIGLVAGASFFLRLDPVSACWVGLLLFLTTGIALQLKSFITRCYAFEGADSDEIETSLPDNVVKLPTRMNYKRISN